MNVAVRLFILSLLAHLFGSLLLSMLYASGSINSETAMAWGGFIVSIPLGCFFALIGIAAAEAWDQVNDRRFGRE